MFVICQTFSEKCMCTLLQDSVKSECMAIMTDIQNCKIVLINGPI